MVKFVIQAGGAFGAFHGPEFFEDKAAAKKAAAAYNAALKPEVPPFKVYKLVEVA